MFRKTKLIVLENAFSNTDFKEKFVKKGKIFADTENIIVFYETNKINKRDKLLTFLTKYGKTQEFEVLSEIKLRNWAKRRIEVLKGKIEDTALETLILYAGNNLWEMESEINKLVNYKNGALIKTEDVELLVKSKIETDIFKTIDAIASKNKKKAITLIREHLQEGDAPFYLFSMINFQFRNLLVVKDLIERNLSPYGAKNIHPFVIKKSIILSGRFSFPELKKIYQRLSEIDFDVKVGKIDPGTAIDLLISEI
jgi:DNA polymerase-3 subunit delta